MFQADFRKKFLISSNPLKMTKEWGFSTFLQIATSELSIFGTKVNLDNPYALAILKLFGKFLIPFNPPYSS